MGVGAGDDDDEGRKGIPTWEPCVFFSNVDGVLQLGFTLPSDHYTVHVLNTHRDILSYRHSALTLVWSTSHVGDFNQNLGSPAPYAILCHGQRCVEVVLCVVLSIVNTLGYMYFWDVTISGVST